jgi:hypothetical protein
MIKNNFAQVPDNNIQHEIYGASSFVLPPIGKLFIQYGFFNFEQNSHSLHAAMQHCKPYIVMHHQLLFITL